MTNLEKLGNVWIHLVDDYRVLIEMDFDGSTPIQARITESMASAIAGIEMLMNKLKKEELSTRGKPPQT